jgi:hypothetical protein
MRVVRTDTFFAKPTLKLEIDPLAKSISTAWFKDEGGDGSEFNFPELLMPGFSTWTPSSAGAEKSITDFLGFCLVQGIRGSFLDPKIFDGWLTGSDLKNALEIEVVIERSPPIALPLSKLLAKAPGVAIGTFIGYQIGAEHPMIMLASVPGGILAVSSAIGISKALERGLHMKVEALFKSKSKKARTL